MNNWNNIVKVLILILLSSNLMGQIIDRNKGNASKNQEIKNTFFSNCWYGGNISLGFGGGNNSTTFSFGLFPMIAYKITPDFSIGPRLGFQLNNYRFGSSSKVIKTVLFDVSEAAFARHKFFNILFAHAEYEIQHYQIGTFSLVTDEITKSWSSRQNAYLGVGYNTGGHIATEIMLLYNFLEDDKSLLQPFSTRLGIMINF